MLRTTVVMIAILLTAVPAAAPELSNVKHISCGRSGACVAFASGIRLYSTLGLSMHTHTFDYAGQGDRETGIDADVRGDESDYNAAQSRTLSLAQNYPNPLNPTTAITFTLPHHSRVILKIFDVKGELVRTLADRRVGPGEHTMHWDGTNEKGARVVTGIYFLRLDTELGALTRKLVVAR